MRLSILGALLVTALLACGGSGDDPRSSSNVAAQNATPTSDWPRTMIGEDPAGSADAGTRNSDTDSDPPRYQGSGG